METKQRGKQISVSHCSLCISYLNDFFRSFRGFLSSSSFFIKSFVLINVIFLQYRLYLSEMYNIEVTLTTNMFMSCEYARFGLLSEDVNTYYFSNHDHLTMDNLHNKLNFEEAKQGTWQYILAIYGATTPHNNNCDPNYPCCVCTYTYGLLILLQFSRSFSKALDLTIAFCPPNPCGVTQTFNHPDLI